MVYYGWQLALAGTNTMTINNHSKLINIPSLLGTVSLSTATNTYCSQEPNKKRSSTMVGAWMGIPTYWLLTIVIGCYRGYNLPTGVLIMAIKLYPKCISKYGCSCLYSSFFLLEKPPLMHPGHWLAMVYQSNTCHMAINGISYIDQLTMVDPGSSFDQHYLLPSCMESVAEWNVG